MNNPEEKINRLNFSFSSKCNAHCIYCPICVDKCEMKSFMELKDLVLVLKNLKSNCIVSVPDIVAGNHGEGLMAPDFIEMMREIRRAYPSSKIILFTNFLLLDKTKSEILLKEKLIDVITFNIDGATELSYRAVKAISLTIVEENVKTFIKIRNHTSSNCQAVLRILPFSLYVREVKKALNILPRNIQELDTRIINQLVENEDTLDIVNKWIPRLKNTDSIAILPVKLWAERDQIEDYLEYYECPLLSLLRQECFVAPNGDWYFCCFDHQFNLIIGSLIKDSVNTLFHSQKRRRLIESLEHKEFIKIGYPCTKVKGCREVSKPQRISTNTKRRIIVIAEKLIKIADIITRKLFRGILETEKSLQKTEELNRALKTGNKFGKSGR